jgi:hypothetical protein
MNQLTRQLAESALDGAYAQVSDVVSALDAASFMLPSRCAGWAVADVLYHELLDARRALRTFATPATGAPDRDDVSYWRPFSAGGDIPPGGAAAAEHARHVRIVASAFTPAELRTADFIGTLAVEAAVHYLDLTIAIPTAAAPDPLSLGLVRRVLDGILGESPPDGWDDLTYVLKGTGRLALTDTERAGLGPAAHRFPLFG